MGAYKALLTFDSVLNAEEAYTFKMNSLLQLFHRVWRWDESEKSETRRVWLECFAVPLHAWSVDTFRIIGNQWGEVVGYDEATKSCQSFSVGRIQIDTCVLDVINEWVHITIGISGFDVLVKEVGRETFGANCHAGTVIDKAISYGIQKNICGAAVMGSNSSKSSTICTDQAAEVIMEGLREKVEDKDKLVLSETILNEWNYDHLRPNQMNIVTIHSHNPRIDVLADLMRYERSTIDSELTISWSYCCKPNGLTKEATRPAPLLSNIGHTEGNQGSYHLLGHEDRRSEEAHHDGGMGMHDGPGWRCPGHPKRTQ
ncbi:hypothetical protein AAHE18_02G135400 [Arachis hypogaea]